MNLEEYQSIILGTTNDDWTEVAHDGPTYLDQLSIGILSGRQEIDIQGHGYRFSYKNDLNIWLALGHSANPNYQADWANQFPNPHASSSWVDFFYGSSLVFRDLYVAVDGGRCYLPNPQPHLDDNDKLVSYQVTHTRSSGFRLLDSLIQVSQYSSYLERAGIELIDGGWMV